MGSYTLTCNWYSHQFYWNKRDSNGVGFIEKTSVFCFVFNKKVIAFHLHVWLLPWEVFSSSMVGIWVKVGTIVTNTQTEWYPTTPSIYNKDFFCNGHNSSNIFVIHIRPELVSGSWMKINSIMDKSTFQTSWYVTLILKLYPTSFFQSRINTSILISKYKLQ